MAKKQHKAVKRRRRTITLEFKQQAVQMLMDGYSACSVLENLGIGNTNFVYSGKAEQVAEGVDGPTAADYKVNLEPNLQSLLDRIHSGTYRAPPVRRVQIPKAGSKETRPIGFPTFEDKLLQRAVLMLLEPIFEQDSYDCSYGFRPGRSTHQAIDATWM